MAQISSAEVLQPRDASFDTPLAPTVLAPSSELMEPSTGCSPMEMSGAGFAELLCTAELSPKMSGAGFAELLCTAELSPEDT